MHEAACPIICLGLVPDRLLYAYAVDSVLMTAAHAAAAAASMTAAVTATAVITALLASLTCRHFFYKCHEDPLSRTHSILNEGLQVRMRRSSNYSQGSSADKPRT